MRDGKIMTMTACKLLYSNSSYNLFTRVFFSVLALKEFLTLSCNCPVKCSKGFEAISIPVVLLLILVNKQFFWSE